MFNSKWRFFVNVNSEQKAKKSAEKILKKINLENTTIISINKYWKDNNKFEISLLITINTKSCAEAIFSILKLVGVFSHDGCYLSTPSFYDNGIIEFSGHTKNKDDGQRFANHSEITQIFMDVTNARGVSITPCQFSNLG